MGTGTVPSLQGTTFVRSCAGRPAIQFFESSSVVRHSLVMALPLNGRAGPARAALVHLLLATQGHHNLGQGPSFFFCDPWICEGVK